MLAAEFCSDVAAHVFVCKKKSERSSSGQSSLHFTSSSIQFSCGRNTSSSVNVGLARNNFASTIDVLFVGFFFQVN